MRLLFEGRTFQNVKISKTLTQDLGKGLTLQ